MSGELLTFLPRKGFDGKDEYFVLLGNRNLGSIRRPYVYSAKSLAREYRPYEFVKERHYITGYDDQIRDFLAPMNVALRLGRKL